MGLDPKTLSPNIIARMTDEQKMQFGILATPDTGGGVPAGEEALLQQKIAGWLHLNGVRFINPPMHLKSLLPPGWPDFSFCYRGKPYAIECKTKVGKCSPGQTGMQRDLSNEDNGWNVAVVRDFAGFISLINQ